jgi:hypothetical protein
VKRTREKWALFAGSVIGIGQAYLGLAIYARYGQLATFVASWAIYVFFAKFYLWATESTTDEPK